MGLRLKRMIAFMIDWNLCGFPCLLGATIALILAADGEEIRLLPALLCVLFALALPVLFLMRDALFRGRSPGKRLFGLTVVDRETLTTPTTGRLIGRNAFLFVFLFDGVVLLATGRTFGDRAAKTIVLRETDLTGEIDPWAVNTTDSKKDLLRVLAAILALFAVLVAIVAISLYFVSDNPEVQMARDWFLASETFASLDADESDVHLNGYSMHTTTAGGVTETEMTCTFRVNGQPYEVVCHREGENWFVCEDCTAFR